MKVTNSKLLAEIDTLTDITRGDADDLEVVKILTKAVNKHRRTGRTTRMVEAATKAASEGSPVYLFFSSDAEVNYWKKQIGTDFAGLLKIERFQLQGFDWERERYMGSHPNCKFFVDHHVIDVRFGYILDMYTRYDDLGV